MDIFSLTPISLILFVNSLFLVFLGFYLWRRGSYHFFSLVMFAAAFWAFSSSLENGLAFMSDKIFWAKMTYIGIYSITPFWLLFSLQYAKFQKSFIKKINYFVWLVPSFLFSLTITNEWHHLFWTSIEPIGGSVSNGLIYSRGIGVYISMVYSYLLIFAGILVLAIYAFRATRVQRSQVFTLFLGLLFPWLVNFFYLSYSPELSRGVDLTPVAFAITGVFAALSIFKFKLSAVIPAAKDLVYHSLEVGVIVVNKENAVVDFNPMAKRFLGDNLANGITADKVLITKGLSLKSIIDAGKNLSISLAESGKCFDIHFNDLIDKSGESIGKTVLFYDVTIQKNVEKELEKSNRFFSDLTDFLPDAMLVIDVNKKIVFWNKAMEKLTGVKSSDMVGKGNYEYAIPFYGERRPMLVDLILENNPSDENWKLYEKEKLEWFGDLITTKVLDKFLRKDGIYLWVLVKPIYDSSGKIIYVVESIRDIDDLHKNQEELKSKIEELSAMNKVMVNRELKMIKLKEELNLLKSKLASK